MMHGGVAKEGSKRVEAYEWFAGRWTGITDSEKRAKRHCELHMPDGGTARVVKVRSQFGDSRPLGSGWTGTKARGRVEWTDARWAS
jgi:hypothetical protein